MKYEDIQKVNILRTERERLQGELRGFKELEREGAQINVSVYPFGGKLKLTKYCPGYKKILKTCKRSMRDQIAAIDCSLADFGIDMRGRS